MERGGLGAVMLFVLVFYIEAFTPGRTVGHGGNLSHEADERDAGIVRFLAVGDVNLGREVGQRILRGDTLFPFAKVVEKFSTYDVVFANLECTLSEQGGETQHPRNNLIFTGPPAGAHALKRAGVTVVSTANNHALDYGLRAHRETIGNLRAAGLLFAGTSVDSLELYEPVQFEVNGIRFALFACTDVMNIENPIWKRYVAEADTSRLLPAVRVYKEKVDFIIVSYHGGDEYTDRPTRRTQRFMEQVIEGGADLVVGHHPHVPHGIHEYGTKLAVHSLGNFVFYQPFALWTQWSFALEAVIVKDEEGTRMISFSCLPVAAGLQPSFVTDEEAAGMVLNRVQALSSREIPERIVW